MAELYRNQRGVFQELDAAIAGGGPAGAAAALLLARDGLAVAVIERAAFPRTKACGEYLSPAAVRVLRELGVADEIEAAAQPLHGIRLYNRGARAELPLRGTGWSLPRSVLDDALLRAAQNAGARVVRGRIEDVDLSGERGAVAVRMPDGALQRIQAAFVIGADGAHSIVAKRAGLTREREGAARFAIGGHYAGLRDFDGRVEMFVDADGYFAINPLGESRANVMLVVAERELRERRGGIDALVGERAQALGVHHGFAQARLEGRRIAVGPLEHRAARYSLPRLLLIGDAAHFLDPFTGQGVYLALYGARLAARAVVQGWPAEAFDRALRREIVRRSRLGRAASLLVRMPWLAPCAPAFSPLLGAIAG